ncbi:MAG: hypothetical protein JW871_04265 [Endomicrobiales bacterium]|nr:hypothetical protein [Endomicrobiales bacterium]
MDLGKLQAFFMWGLLINLAIYIFSVGVTLSLRGFIARMHGKFFGLSEESVNKAVYLYFGIYKVIINAFFLAPWIATMVIK